MVRPSISFVFGAGLLAVAGCSSTPNGGDGGLVGKDAGGMAGDAVAAADGGAAGASGNCTFSVTDSLSTKIPTVGIVTWSTTLPAPTEAHVDFGLTTAYGMTAPIDLSSPGYRTLLLGMKPSHTYHFRIEASGTSGQCTSADATITTGPVSNGMPTVIATTVDRSATFGGFLITGQYVKFPSASGVPAYILDADGDIVWWYFLASATRAACE